MIENQKISARASAYILTLISRLDSAICFQLFKFFAKYDKPEQDNFRVFEHYFAEDKYLCEKEEEFKKAIKKCGSMLKEEQNISYPLDIFGTNKIINFLKHYDKTEKFTEELSDAMIVYTSKKTKLIEDLSNVYLLRQKLEHPDTKDKDNYIKIKETKYAFDFDKSIKSLFLFLPERYMNEIIALLYNNEEDRNSDGYQKLEGIREWVLQTNRKFRERLNEKINEK